MGERHQRNDWQVVGASVLIALGVLLFLNRIEFAWWGMVRDAFDFAFDFAWPVALIGLGAILLISARKGAGAGGGASTGDTGTGASEAARLRRSRSERMVGGVLGGLGVYLNIDPTWIRVIFVVLAVLSGQWFLAALIYLAALILIPEESRTTTAPAWPNVGGTTPEPPVWAQQPANSTETVQVPEPPAPASAPEPPVTPEPPAPQG